MPVYSFSAKSNKPEDIRLVEETKLRCERQGKNFSALIIQLLREHKNEQSRKG